MTEILVDMTFWETVFGLGASVPVMAVGIFVAKTMWTLPKKYLSKESFQSVLDEQNKKLDNIHRDIKEINRRCFQFIKNGAHPKGNN